MLEPPNSSPWVHINLIEFHILYYRVIVVSCECQFLPEVNLFISLNLIFHLLDQSFVKMIF